MSYQYGVLHNYGWNNRGIDRRYFLILLKKNLKVRNSHFRQQTTNDLLRGTCINTDIIWPGNVLDLQFLIFEFNSSRIKNYVTFFMIKKEFTNVVSSLLGIK